MPAGLPLSVSFSRAIVVFYAELRAALEAEGIADRVEPGMGPLLFALFAGDGRTMSELADVIGAPRSTITGVVRRMVERGLVKTARDELDARAIRVRLLPAGRRTEANLRRIATRLDQLLGASLSAADQQRLATALDRIQSHASRATQERGARRGKPGNGARAAARNTSG